MLDISKNSNDWFTKNAQNTLANLCSETNVPVWP